MAVATHMTAVRLPWPGRVILLLLVLAAAPAGAQRRAPAPADRPLSRALSQFPGLARLFRDTAGRPGGEATAARVFDFEQVLTAVTGRADSGGHTLEEYLHALGGERELRVPADRESGRRDETAYRLHSLGYSPREIADVLAGRITKKALDNAQKLLMVGVPAARVSDYLDREYRRQAEARRPARGKLPSPAGTAAMEALVAKYAAVHGVERALVRAVAATESRWNQQARSPAGAIGLMQLMPGTARELGVDPADLEQNVEGGIRYLSWLLRTFRSVESALIAYNAGPGFAQRFTRGEVALYGETREFVRRVRQAMGQGLS